ncbi:hypothetical protein [Phosphitispora fastidiosa]|uniref:hypothetical protein n=1 Tax=Phosphitispora fastidiosa TaxID=2837202 RepID=UPI001E5D8F7D|nr:hypothetical protein [Phosphitispora fastidiosa]MBU7005762.1 hypothetical protein [Phosphitispora fastidiosa]
MDGYRITHTKTNKGAEQGQSVSTTGKAPVNAPAHPILGLQQVIGNRAVVRLLQAKSSVGGSGDEYEQEADRVAQSVGDFRSVDVTQINDIALEQEYMMVQRRLQNPSGYLGRDADEAYLQTIEAEISQRESLKAKQRQAAAKVSTVVVNYDSFCDSSGNMTDDRAAMRMVSSWEQLDKVYQDADSGNPRAQKIIGQIENVYRAAGIAAADRTAQLGCLIPVYSDAKDIVPGELLGDRCTPNWSSLNYLRADKPGGRRLRDTIGRAFEERARKLHVYDELIIKSLNLLMVSFVVRGALKPNTPVSPTAAAGAVEGAEAAAAGEVKAAVTGEVKAAVTGETKAAVTGEAQAAAEAPAGSPSRVWVGGGRKGGSYKEVKQPPVEKVSRPRTPEDESIAAAIAERGKMTPAPKGKTSASVEGNSTESGWTTGPRAAENTEAVMELSKKMGHDLQPNKLLDQGKPGRYHASHAEKQAAVAAPNKPIAVSAPMCDNCRRFFRALARYTGKPQTVAEPRAVWVFRPDGSVLVVPK